MHKSQLEPTSYTLKAANGTEITVLGQATVPLVTPWYESTVTGLVTDHVAEVMLGIDWLSDNDADWKFRDSSVYLGGYKHKLHVRAKDQKWCRRVVVQEDTSVPPRSQQNLKCRVVFHGRPSRAETQQWETESAALQCGLLVARTLTPPDRYTDVPVRVMNLDEDVKQVRAGTVISDLEPVTVLGAVDSSSAQLSSATSTDLPECMQKLIDGVDPETPEGVVTRLKELMVRYDQIFSKSETDLGLTSILTHRIDTGGARPIRQPLRKFPPAHVEAITEQVDKLLEQGVIEPATSPWASNVVLVRKKDGSYRCCIDYRQLNSVTTKDAYPVPRMDSCLDAMAGAGWFSTIDMPSAYHQVYVEPQDSDKTAFICPRGMFRYRTMPFGLCNAGATFQRLMDIVMSGLHLDICLAYLDDIIVYAKSPEEHLARLEIVFHRLQGAGLKLKPEKCLFFQRSVEFLGHVVSADGIETSPDKIQAVVEWPVPTSVTEVRSFIGLASYYRRFVRDFSKIAAPLNSLMQKDKKFTWTEEAQQSFEKLKSALTSPPVLAMPMDEGLFTLDTDASNESIGAVLSQQQSGEERVIAFASRTLDKREKNYCVTRKELLAVVYFLRHFKQYLLGRRFRVRTDHAALTWLRKTPEPIGQQARWLESMEEFDFAVEHRPGNRHANADALSRRPCPKRDCLCKEPSPAFFSGPADRPANQADVGQRDKRELTTTSPLSCKTTSCIRAEGETELKTRLPTLSGPADRPAIGRRRRRWRRIVEPRLPTIVEEEETTDVGASQLPSRQVITGESMMSSSSMNPYAEPYTPAGEARTAAVHVEPDAPEAAVVPDSVESQSGEGDQQSALWSPAGLESAQKSDPDIGFVYRLIESGVSKPTWSEIVHQSGDIKTLWSFWQRLAIRQGILQRRFESIDQKTEYWQTIMPKTYREEFVRAIHAGATGGHFGLRKTTAAVQSRAYWPTWSSDVATCLRKCPECARYHRGTLPRQAEMQTPRAGEPWERVSIDITGPHPKSSSQKVFILTLVDHFSKWAEAIAIANHTAVTVARALMTNVFSRFGMPSEILTDRGSEFESELFAQLLRWLEIDKLRTTAYKPSTNGTVERFHRTLNSVLGKVVSENQRDWDQRLPFALAAYRASVHSSTGFTPNRVFLGRENRMPIDLAMGLPPDESSDCTTVDEYVAKQQQLADETYQLVRQHLGQNAQRRKATYDARVRKNEYKEGNWVWYYYPRRFTNKSPKWQRNFTGPYRIVRTIPPVNYVLQRSRRSKPFVVHADKLKRCHSPPTVDWTLSGEAGEPEAEPETPTAPASLPRPVQPVGRKRRSSPEVNSIPVDVEVEETDENLSCLRTPRIPRERKKPRYLTEYVCRSAVVPSMMQYSCYEEC